MIATGDGRSFISFRITSVRIFSEGEQPSYYRLLASILSRLTSGRIAGNMATRTIPHGRGACFHRIFLLLCQTARPYNSAHNRSNAERTSPQTLSLLSTSRQTIKPCEMQVEAVSGNPKREIWHACFAIAASGRAGRTQKQAWTNARGPETSRANSANKTRIKRPSAAAIRNVRS